jgi:hypothetical protein
LERIQASPSPRINEGEIQVIKEDETRSKREGEKGREKKATPSLHQKKKNKTKQPFPLQIGNHTPYYHRDPSPSP